LVSMAFDKAPFRSEGPRLQVAHPDDRAVK
jgi:hypothetical protein